jgi:nicotinamidase-related amidase
MRIDNLVICGAMTHMCIDATTRAAFDLGFNCTVAEDACATMDLVFKQEDHKGTGGSCILYGCIIASVCQGNINR